MATNPDPLYVKFPYVKNKNLVGINGTKSNGISIGELAGQIKQGDSSIAIGNLSGQFNQGISSIAIGNQTGANNQGDYALAIGNMAGYDGQGISSVAIGNNAQNNGYSNSVSLGSNASNDSDNQIVLGTGSENVLIPGNLTVYGTINGIVLSTIASGITGPVGATGQAGINGTNGATGHVGPAGPSISSSNSMIGGLAVNIKSLSVTYLGIFNGSFSQNADTTERNSISAIPFNCMVSNFYVYFNAAAGTSTSFYRLTIRKNGVDTLISVTITGAAKSGSNITGSEIFNSGDLFSISAVPSISPSPTNGIDVRWVCRLTSI